MKRCSNSATDHSEPSSAEIQVAAPAGGAVTAASSGSGGAVAPETAERLSKSKSTISRSTSSDTAAVSARGAAASNSNSNTDSCPDMDAANAGSARLFFAAASVPNGSSNSRSGKSKRSARFSTAGVCDDVTLTGRIRAPYFPWLRMESAAVQNGAASQALSRFAAMSSIQHSKPAKISSQKALKTSLAGFWSANHPLSSCSSDQAASPNSSSPTMRELPLRV